jgi:hypothetical protein
MRPEISHGDVRCSVCLRRVIVGAPRRPRVYCCVECRQVAERDRQRREREARS